MDSILIIWTQRVPRRLSPSSSESSLVPWAPSGQLCLFVDVAGCRLLLHSIPYLNSGAPVCSMPGIRPSQYRSVPAILNRVRGSLSFSVPRETNGTHTHTGRETQRRLPSRPKWTRQYCWSDYSRERLHIATLSRSLPAQGEEGWPIFLHRLLLVSGALLPWN